MNQTLCEVRQQTEAAQNTLGEIQKQTILARQEVVGSQGAILALETQLATSPPGIIVGARPAVGRVPAKKVVLNMTAQRVSLPDKRPIGAPTPCNLDIPVLIDAAVAGFTNGNGRVCAVEGFSHSSIDEVMHTRQSILLKGTFTYNNGFGDVVSKQICRMVLGYKFNSPKSSGEGRSFFDCTEFDIELRRATESKNKYGDSYVDQSLP